MMTIIEFVFFTGWLKVAQALLNPFGDDDDDFECNYLIDKNFAVRFCEVLGRSELHIKNLNSFLFVLDDNSSNEIISLFSQVKKIPLSLKQNIADKFVHCRQL